LDQSRETTPTEHQENRKLFVSQLDMGVDKPALRKVFSKVCESLFLLTVLHTKLDGFLECVSSMAKSKKSVLYLENLQHSRTLSLRLYRPRHGLWRCMKGTWKGSIRRKYLWLLRMRRWQSMCYVFGFLNDELMDEILERKFGMRRSCIYRISLWPRRKMNLRICLERCVLYLHSIGRV
jgi:hypothetical protein